MGYNRLMKPVIPQTPVTPDRVADDAFRISVIFKGIGGAMELLTGLVLIFISTATLQLAVQPLGHFGEEISKEISEGTRLFVIFYAVSRGIIRLGLAICLLQLRLWAYPVAIGFLVLTILYQLWLMIDHASIGLVLLTIFDVGIIALTWYEYRKLKRGGTLHEGLL